MVRKGEGPDTGRVERCRRVMVFASKGGVGKTTVASNLLVSAALDGIEAIGVDFDGQRHLIPTSENIDPSNRAGSSPRGPCKRGSAFSQVGISARLRRGDGAGLTG